MSAETTTDTTTDAAATLVTETELSVSEPEMKKKELIDLVVERSGVKKKFAKPVVEAMMAVMGETLASGREMNLQPMGKVKVMKSKTVANGTVLNARIRQSDQAIEKAEDSGDDGLADAED